MPLLSIINVLYYILNTLLINYYSIEVTKELKLDKHLFN